MNLFRILLFAIPLLLSHSVCFAQQEPPDTKETLLTLEAQDVAIEHLAELISEQIEGTISLHGDIIPTTVCLTVENAPIKKALNQIANPNGWVWWTEDNGDYGISTREHYERNILPCGRRMQKVFRPTNMTAKKAEQRIKHLLTPGHGVSVADNRTNKVIIIDTPEQYQVIEQHLRELDNSPWRIFSIDYWQRKKHQK